jgi:tRNA (cmo5U34)-methyltransferase
MTRDRIFAATAARTSDFIFDGQVAAAFDDMVVRSVPFYAEQQYMIAEIVRKFWLPGGAVYDFGCATATTLINLARSLDAAAPLVGYDSSAAMLEQAAQKIDEAGLTGRIELREGDLNGELSTLTLGGVCAVILCWTLQFVRPLRRDALIRWIYDALPTGGVLIVTEKILTNDTHMNRFFIDLYYDFKRRNDYSEVEIAQKREALENVLIPYRIDENLHLFRRCGFENVETFFQWYNFAGFLCVKKQA